MQRTTAGDSVIDGNSLLPGRGALLQPSARFLRCSPLVRRHLADGPGWSRLPGRANSRAILCVDQKAAAARKIRPKSKTGIQQDQQAERTEYSPSAHLLPYQLCHGRYDQNR